MLKRVLQRIAPSFLLNYYKKKQFYKTIRDFQIADEPDLLVARKLISAEDTILDIGANIGLYVHFLSPYVNRVIAFEPVPFTFSMLSHNTGKFNWQNIELHQLAISEENGEAAIRIPVQAGVRNYFRAALSADHSEVEAEMNFKVKTRSLDSFCSERDENISFIKCDTEGHELSIIKGATEFLKTNSPAWLMEVSGDPDISGSESFELFELMRKHHYEIYFYKDGILHKRKKGDESINYFFLKESHFQAIKGSSITINH